MNAGAKETYLTRVRALRDDPATSARLDEAAVVMFEVGGWVVATWPEDLVELVAADLKLAGVLGSQVIVAMHAALTAPEWGRAFVERLHWLDDIEVEEGGASLDDAARAFISLFPVAIQHEAAG